MAILSDQFDFWQSEPAGVSSAGNRVVHGIVSYEEEGLEELHTPSKCSRLASLLTKQLHRDAVREYSMNMRNSLSGVIKIRQDATG